MSQQPTTLDADRESSNPAPLPDEIRPIYSKVQNRLHGLDSKTVKEYRLIGKLLIEAEEKFLPLSRFPYRNIITWFANLLQTSERLLYHCRNVAERISDSDFQLLLQAPINWSHVVVILNWSLDDNVQHWVSRIIAENLSATAVEDEIRSRIANARPGSGRRPAVPSNLDVGLLKLGKTLTATINKLQQAFFADEFDLPQEAEKVQVGEIQPHLIAALNARAGQLQYLSEIAHENAQRLTAASHRIENLVRNSQPSATPAPRRRPLRGVTMPAAAAPRQS